MERAEPWDDLVRNINRVGRQSHMYQQVHHRATDMIHAARRCAAEVARDCEVIDGEPAAEEPLSATDEFLANIATQECSQQSNSQYILDVDANPPTQEEHPGFTYVPNFKYDIGKILINLKLYTRQLNLNIFFANNINRVNRDSSSLTLKRSSTFIPPQNPMIHLFETLCEVQIRRALKKPTLLEDNLTTAERFCLKELTTNDKFRVMKPDKGGGVVVMTKTDYLNKMTIMLSDGDTYEKVSKYEMCRANTKVDWHLYELLVDGMIDKDEYDYFMVEFPITPSIFGIPKIHKNTNNKPFRPTVSARGSKMEAVAHYIDFNCKDILKKLPHILRDSWHCLDVREHTADISKNTIMVTIDIVNLFSVIPYQLGLEMFETSLFNFGHMHTVKRKLMVELMEMVLENNYMFMDGDSEQLVIDSWDCSFPDDCTEVEPTENSESLCTLLAEFFKYFMEFDFAGNVISLREGKVLPVTDFMNPKVERKFKLGPMNIQDPFELVHNVAGNINERTAQRFKKECKDASKYCRSLQYQKKSSKGKIWGLVRLFQPRSTTEWSPTSSPSTDQVEAADKNETLIAIPFKASTLPDNTKKELCLSSDFRDVWFNKICHAMLYVMEEVLKCNCCCTEESGVDEVSFEVSHTDSVTKCDQSKGVPLSTSERSLEGEDGVGICHTGSENKCDLTKAIPRDASHSASKSCLEEDDGVDFVQSDSDIKCYQAKYTSHSASKRSLEEEENAVEHSTSKKPRLDSKKYTNGVNWYCTVWHKVWMGRRKMRRQLLHSAAEDGAEGDANPADGTLEANGLDLEAKVTEALLQQESKTEVSEPLLTFSLSARVAGENENTKTLLSVIPVQGNSSLFLDFFHFLESFIPKSVEKYIEKAE
ncbi:uncharacterized protein LOC122789818 [Protopterus annectens]|uniref:uncharacterized protein LOC122789818 n=1 Tax=Protopterus annectens TaxID=7888 RepID=UPI001CFA812E|nr:uncharacterized protein LOC122789818 [Protopterus annectens]